MKVVSQRVGNKIEYLFPLSNEYFCLFIVCISDYVRMCLNMSHKILGFLGKRFCERKKFHILRDYYLPFFFCLPYSYRTWRRKCIWYLIARKREKMFKMFLWISLLLISRADRFFHTHRLIISAVSSPQLDVSLS